MECAAGAVLVAAADRPSPGDAITADLVWFDEQPLAIGRRYLMQIGAARVPAQVEAIETRLDGGADAPLAMNGIARVRLRGDMAVVALPYADNRALGAFVLIDRAGNATAAAGMVRAVSLGDRAAEREAAPIHAFAAGDPAAADLVARLHAFGTPALVLDTATLRAGVAADLPADAALALWERAGAVAALLAKAGVTVALAIPRPADGEPIGKPWTGEVDTGDWVI